MKKTLFTLLSIACFSTAFALAPTDSTGTIARHGFVYIIHTVTEGETLYKISKHYHVSVEEIQKENTNTHALAIGQELFIPTNRKANTPVTPTSGAAKTHTVAAGEGLYSISKAHHITVEDIVKWNNLTSNSINVGQTLLVSAPIANKPAAQLPVQATNNITHTVAAGEGLYSISKKYNVSIEEIKKLNNLTSDALNANQVLIIKEGKATATAPKSEPIKTAATTTAAAQEIKHPTKLQPSNATGNASRKEEQGVIGFATLPDYNAKFSYGLHKTAPVGTVIKVTNSKGAVHWVRIMGKLDTTETAIMKVNKTVMEKLGEGATSFNGTISYAL